MTADQRKVYVKLTKDVLRACKGLPLSEVAEIVFLKIVNVAVEEEKAIWVKLIYVDDKKPKN